MTHEHEHAFDSVRARLGNPSTSAFLLIGMLFVVRVLYAAVTPLDLVHDEAYYWDWSRQLDWGYYSKPPMVAWLIWLSTLAGSGAAVMVRLPAIALGTFGLVWVYLLGARMYSPRAGFWAVVLSAINPGNAAMSLLMTIDAPLMFFWSAALYACWRWLEDERPSGFWWAAATAALGLGFLSKQTMLGFLPLAFLFLLTHRDDRSRLARPAAWLMPATAMLFLLPVVWWNSQHDWITLQHTGEHFSTASVGLLKRLTRSLEFIGGQAGVISPVTWWLVMTVLAAGLLSWRRLERHERYLLAFSGVPLAGVLLLSLKQRIEPNWPAPFYPAAMVLAAGWIVRGKQLGRWRAPPARALPRAAWVGAVCVVVAYLAPFGWGLQGTKFDPVVRLRGWRELGAAVEARFDELPRAERSFVLVYGNRAWASELAFYMPRQPEVFMYSPGGRPTSQYDIWGGPAGKSGWDALIVTPPGDGPPPQVVGAFRRLEPAGEVNIAIGAGRAHHCQLWRGVDYLAWPGDIDVLRIAEESGSNRPLER